MILGVDISTKKIGLAVINQEKNNVLCTIEHLETLFLDNKIKKDIDFISLEEKAQNFKYKIEDLKKKFEIDNIFVEAAMNFGGPNANTIALLLRFNGMCTYILYNIFNKLPHMINVRSARSILGIKIPKINNKKLNEHEKKKPIIDYIFQYFNNTNTPFVYEITNKGNPKPGVDDMADALVLAIAGPILLSKQ